VRSAGEDAARGDHSAEWEDRVRAKPDALEAFEEKAVWGRARLLGE
jgi:hypothetical protein